MDMKAFVLCNVPECSLHHLQDYVEATVDIEVSQVKMHPDVPHRALILLEDEMEDVESAKQAVSDECLNEQKIQLLPIQQLMCILYVSNIDPNILSGEVLQLYLMSVFAYGEDVITTCQLSEDKETAVVFFQNNEVVERILSAGEHVPLPSYSESYHIRIEACYSDFHDKIGIVEKAMDGRTKAVQNLPVLDEFRPTADGNISGNTSFNEAYESERIEKTISTGDDFNLGEALGKDTFSDKDGGASNRGAKQKYSRRSGLHSVTRGGQQQRQRGERQRKGGRDKQYKRNKTDLKEDSKQPWKSDISKLKSQQGANSFPSFDDELTFPTQKASFNLSMFPIPYAREQTDIEESLSFSKSVSLKSASAINMHQQKPPAEESERREKEDSENYRAEVQKLREEVERLKSKPKETSVKLSVTPMQGKLLTPFLNSIKAQYNNAERAVILSGDEQKIIEGKIAVLEQLQLVKEEFLDLSLGMQDILKTRKGQDYVDNLVQTQLKEVEICIGDTLQMASFNTESLAEAKKILKKKVNSKKRIEMKAQMSSDKLNDFNMELEKNYLVSILWDDKENDITVEGVEDDIAIAEREIKELLEEYGTICVKFVVTGIQATFFNKHLLADIRMLLKNSIKNLTATNLKFEVVYETQKKTSAEQLEKLQKMKDSIQIHKINLTDLFSRPEDRMLFLIGLKEKRESLEREHMCYFSFPNPEGDRHPKQDLNQEQKTKSQKADVVKPESLPKIVKIPSQKIVADAGSGFNLVIKPYGDIILEKADILVCVVGPKVDLRSTRVGLTFNQTSRDLWKKLEAEYEANPQASVLVTKGPLTNLKCQAICHVILHPWNQRSSATELKNALDTVFIQCSQLQAKSVSFPAMGCGRAFKFPPDNVCQEMLTSFHDFVKANPSSSLKTVKFLAKDSELFRAFQKSVPTFFGPSPLPAMGAVGGVQPTDSEDETSSDEGSDSSSNSDGEEEMQAHIQNREIMLVGMQRMDTLCEKMKKSVQEEYIYTDYFTQNLLPNFPKSMRCKILQHAKHNNVWVERSVDPKTKGSRYVIKGKKHKVTETKLFIQKEFFEVEKVLPKRRIASHGAPKRGTLEFLKYAAQSDELFPSYWKLGQSKIFLKNIKDRFQKFMSSKKRFVVDVDYRTKTAIGNLVKETWDSSNVGRGQDAHGLSHTNINIVKVERIENPTLFEHYFHRRKQLFVEAAASGQVCPNIGKIRSSKGPVLTAKKMDPLLKKELYEEVNEHYLFHGTKKDMLDAIITHGLDPKVSSIKAMFGKGVYGAESATKSDQYADTRDRRTSNGTELKLIVMRMLLGKVFLIDSNHQSVTSKDAAKLHRPPCTQCSQDKCSCGKPLFDSVMGDGNWLFREFVVYDSDRCYPEYIVTYERV